MADNKFEVPVDKLRRVCEPSQFDFTCTKDLVPLREFIGQDRAIRAVDFGLNVRNGGYNIYVAGVNGTGKTTAVKGHIQRIIKEKKDFKVSDWCYVYNFREPDAPRVLEVPQGRGKILRDQVSQLLERIKDNLGRAFAGDEYKNQRQQIVEEGRKEQQRALEEVGRQATKEGFAIQMTAMGPALIPTVEGQPMEEKDYHALDEGTRAKIEEKQSALRKKLETAIEQAQTSARQTAEQLEKMDKSVGDYTISRLFEPLLREWGDIQKAREYLEGLRSHTLDNLGAFKSTEEQMHPLLGVPMSQVSSGRNPLLPYQVNLFVDNSETKGPPVIEETNPNFGNMFGKIERRFLFGGYLSDHTMLKPGAISRANGGYLLLHAPDVLLNPGVWPAFKRAIKNKEVRIEDPYEQFGLVAPQAMKPEPMPINVKFVLTGDPMLYQLLSAYDEDFWEIFKVKAEFDSRVHRQEGIMKDYAAFLAGCCEECKTFHFDPGGVCKMIEHASRMVEDQERLSTRFGFLKDIVIEADYWARADGKDTISAVHVKKAIDEKIYRHNLIEQHVREAIDRGTIFIDTGGSVVGQVNALSVMSLGDITFGRPSRITARTFLGRGGVVDIERETELGGRIHSKGVMILAGYLGWKYAQERPLSLSASVSFEQSYEGVDGDSASSTELYAILSSLANVPIKQNIAITGSVNQKGEVQPIGGANFKIEGFFAACKARGLTGDQGVMLPAKNVVNLMLREEVVDAVREGKFHIWAVNTIDEGIELLTGVPAGQRQADGSYPEGSINYLADQQLKKMAESFKSYMVEEKRELVAGKADGHQKNGPYYDPHLIRRKR